MQRAGCDTIRLLISKYVDGEAAPGERADVDLHVAGCEECARTFTSYMEMAAIFSDVGPRMPAPHVRVSLFSQIERIKVEEERLDRLSHAPQRSAPVPAPTPSRWSRLFNFGARLKSAAGSFTVAAIALFSLLTVVALLARPVPPPTVQRVPREEALLAPEGVPTIPAGIPVEVLAQYLPSPIPTRGADTQPRTATRSATARRAPDGGVVLELENATPVLEAGNPRRSQDWHMVRDAASGYAIKYPPNWWTEVSGNVRTFHAWGPGGTRYAPYWLELQVEDNPHLLNAESANAELFYGTCKAVASTRGSLCRRENYAEGDNIYDELYAFDERHIYALRLVVPIESSLGDFETRWSEAQDIFSGMSGRFSLATSASVNTNGYAPVLFLNGTDLWGVDATGAAYPVTRGYGVRDYTLSPDLRHIAFLADNGSSERGKGYPFLYVADIEAGPDATPRLLWSGGELFDLAWYGDRELIVIAKSESEGLALFRVGAIGNAEGERRLLTSLDQTMQGARGLAVSPDRQLITFLTPLGEYEGTDLYAVRPDGTNLIRVIAHEDVLVPPVSGRSAPDPADMAVKSYLWTEGRLEYGGYTYDLLFTCGNNVSPTLWRGGYLYSGTNPSAGPILDPQLLDVTDPDQVQIVHLAISPQGKLAFTGFYNMRNDYPEVLAGLWTADLREGRLTNIRSLPIPDAPNGIADLQWSPDGTHLIYRETIPRSDARLVSRYESDSDFLLIKLDPESGEAIVLFDGR